MLESRITAAAEAMRGPAGLKARIVKGFPSELDTLASRSLGGHSFLRSAWYAAAAGGDPQTVLALRPDGDPLAAIPTVLQGPPLLGIRSVPGSYWPFRSILISASADRSELAWLLSSSEVRNALAPAWRVGPVPQDDPVAAMLEHCAADAGWTVLLRSLGRSWLLNLAGPASSCAWPRKSTRRRLANYERRLAGEGALEYRHVTGTDWDEATLDALAEIEANSWIARKTDASGAKFLLPAQQELWRHVLGDRHLANHLSATVLRVGARPVAFSFDLRAGDCQYSIACSYDENFADFRPGKLVTYRQFEQAACQGVRIVDLGIGDNGYKREMGAIPGSAIVDLLIVRSRSIGQLLSLQWGAESRIGRDVFLSSAHARSHRQRIMKQIAAASALAGTMIAVAAE
ncbi:MAG: GNAT family N-acetyltransferase [Novosphingobium sp.]|nr:GNAT family N-acetyltransferase [Novosphingobium sp.]